MFMFKADLKFTVFYYSISKYLSLENDPNLQRNHACVPPCYIIFGKWIHVKIISNKTADIFRNDIMIQMDSGLE